MTPVAILASGMVTGVGLTAPATCAAIRCAIDNFQETRFMDHGGEWIMGSQVVLEQPWRGVPKLVQMAVRAIKECLSHAELISTEQIPLLLCVAEKERPGRLGGLDDRLFHEIQAVLGSSFHRLSAVIARGRVGGATALQRARQLLSEERIPFCLIAGVDSYLISETLAAYEEKARLLTSRNSNGFIPGEAGAAVLVGRPMVSDPGRRAAQPAGRELLCVGIGRGEEKAAIESEQPLRGDGLLQAFRAAFADAACPIHDLDFRITDSNGEQYWFKEAALALSRMLRVRKPTFDIWHPVDCVGETGAAIGPCVLGVALSATRKNYAFGRGPLCHFSAEDCERFALVLRTAAERMN
jgi:3-oxoacyl-[acyl-carrier-protein] synthase-1